MRLNPFKRKDKRKQDDLDDANVDAVIARNLWKNHKIFPPSSRFKAHWDLAVLVLVFYNCVYIPIELCFLNSHPDYPKSITHTVIDYLIDGVFVCDMVLTCRTAYYDEDYEMVLEPRRIFRHYFYSSWFWIDFFAVCPFEVPFLIFASDQSDMLTIFGILKLPRLLRLLRVTKKLDVVAAANALRIAALMIFFCLIAHWFACAWCAAPSPRERPPRARRAAGPSSPAAPRLPAAHAHPRPAPSLVTLVNNATPAGAAAS